MTLREVEEITEMCHYTEGASSLVATRGSASSVCACFCDLQVKLRQCE